VGVGFDNVDLEAAGKQGLCVANVPDYGTEEVADSAISLLLNLLRGTHRLAKQVQGGKWPTQDAKGTKRLRGKNVGLIGFGRIGKAFALRGKPFGFNICFYDPYVPDGTDKAFGITRFDDLKELLSTCEIISLHCLLSEETKHIINSITLSYMKPGSYLINSARGGLVCTKDLIESLKQKKLAGVGIDVIEDEPHSSDQSISFPELLEFENVIITPHSAFYSDEAIIELRTKAALEAKRVLTGQKLRNCVNSQFLVNPRC